MDATYDQRSDTFVICLSSSTIVTSAELKQGVIADYDKQGDIVRLEFLDASRTIVFPGSANVSFNFSVE
ncbi:MAG: DUF2283 domain-containing protein [Candidatus Kapabacteria bacterium]|nr:DUF2283 domain-containing protein [Candidatus Kapabacteria bacterium]